MDSQSLLSIQIEADFLCSRIFKDSFLHSDVDRLDFLIN